MADVSEWIEKYGKAMDAVDWDAAASEWTRKRPTFVANYTGTTGLNPIVARKYKRKVEAASYKKPDVGKAKTNYAATMKAA